MADISILQTGRWQPENRHALDGLLLKRGKGSPNYDPASPPAAVFDWDETCIANDIGVLAFFFGIENFLFRLDLEEFWAIFPEQYGRETVHRAWESLRGLAPEEARRRPEYPAYRKGLVQAVWDCFEAEGEIASSVWMARMHVGMTADEVRRMSAGAIEVESKRSLARENISSGPGDAHPIIVKRGVREYAEMKDLVACLHAHGFEVWVVSLTTGRIIEAFADRYGIPRERVKGLALREEKGVLTADLTGPVTAKAGKVEAIERYIGRRPALVAGDSVNDLDMLAYSEGLSLVIDRNRPEVLSAARQKGWLIQEAFIPIELKSSRSYLPEEDAGERGMS